MSCDDEMRFTARYVAPVHEGQEWYSVCGVPRDGPVRSRAILQPHFASVFFLASIIRLHSGSLPHHLL